MLGADVASVTAAGWKKVAGFNKFSAISS
jgi:hypothetical protein